jgi:hypothetical protein
VHAKARDAIALGDVALAHDDDLTGPKTGMGST